MRKIRIVIMGKTGVGKSTIINAILGETKAKTGQGDAITRENQLYKCKKFIDTEPAENGHYGKMNCEILLYDTVGLEVDSQITKETLLKIKKHIEKSKKDSRDEDVNIVWFCINERSNRFESYEANLIKKLSLEYEIPFVVVLTQCISRKVGKLAEVIQEKMPEIPIRRIMAEDFELDDDVVIHSFGLNELLVSSIREFYKYRIDVIESVIDDISVKSDERITKVKCKGDYCISECSHKVGKAGWVPIGCIPYVHGKCIKMISELNDIAGLPKDKEFASEIFSDLIVGLVFTPLMAVPVFSSLVAQSYVETVGKGYLDTLIDILKVSTEKELKDKILIKERMKMHYKEGGNKND